MNPVFAKYCLFLPVVALRNEHVFRELSSLMQSQWHSEEELKKKQARKLRHLLAYAKSNVPYYSGIFKNADIDKSLSSYYDVPMLTKEIIREKRRMLHSNNNYLLKTGKTTGGSTGEPITILKTSSSMAKERAALWRGYSWAGIHIGDRQARFWGVPFKQKDKLIAGVVDFVNNRKRISAFNFDEKRLQQYYDILNRFKPKYFYGYVSAIREFTEYCWAKKLQLKFDLKTIITTAEELTNDDKMLLQNVNKCRVYNEYGSGEVGTIAHECEKGKLHINSENVLVEIVSEDGSRCSNGEIGQIVITELNNTFFPLIRYKIGDMGKLSEEKCLCGRGLPVLEGVYGRAYDVIKTPYGKKYHPSFFNYIFKEIDKYNFGIKQFQVIQQEKSKLLVNIVTSKPTTEKLVYQIKRMINDNIQYNFIIDIENVKAIQREKSGKIRVVKGLSN